jgi:hypothetical protein
MNYVVSGADRTTGRELTLRFQATNPSEAEAFANLSMFVSQVRQEKSAAEPVAYATPKAAKTACEVNWAAGIAFHARLLRILSIFIALTAVLPLGWYGWSLLNQLWNLFVERTARSALSFLEDATMSSPYLLAAVGLLACAVFMRLASHVALAISEIASKS